MLQKLVTFTTAAGLLLVLPLTRIQPAESAGVSASAFAAAERGEILVLHEGEDEPVSYGFESNQAAAEALQEYRSRDDVVIAQPNFRYQATALPDDPLLDQQKHLEIIQAQAGWDIQSNASDVVIAVVDSGVDGTHEDLRENLWVNPDEQQNGLDDDGNGYADDINGWDFLENSPDASPKFNTTTDEDAIGVQHGTMVGGIIAAQGDNNQGVSGIAWDARLMSLRVLNSSGTGTSETVTKALRYAIEQEADIVNLSLVGTEHDPLVVEMLNRAYEADIAVVAAAGNSGANLNAVKTYPVCYNHLGPETVIGVGALGEDFSRPDFSNYGSDCVDMVAPGIDIFSTRVTREHFASQSAYDTLFSGTSFAAPQVTGVIALIKQMNPSLGSSEILKLLQDGANDLSEIHATGVGFDYALDAGNTLSAVNTAPQDNEGGEESGGTEEQPPQFIAYPLSSFEGAAYKYQFPGPLAVSPVIFGEETFENGMSFARRSEFSALIHEAGGKEVFVNNFLTGEFSPLFELPEDAHSIGEIAIGNVDFDPQDDLVVTSASGEKATVSIYNFDGQKKYSFSPYSDGIDGGLSVSLIDTNGDDVKEIAVVPKNQSDGHIKIFEYTGLLLKEWNAYKDFGGGATLSTADTNEDGEEELLVGPGATGGPHVKVFGPTGDLRREFFGGNIRDGGGADVHFLDINGDGGKEFVLSYKTTHTPVVRLYSPEGTFQEEIGVLSGEHRGGVGIYPL